MVLMFRSQRWKGEMGDEDRIICYLILLLCKRVYSVLVTQGKAEAGHK